MASGLPHSRQRAAVVDARLLACGLPQAWSGAPAWRVLDCAFAAGDAFAATVAAWRGDGARPPLLHYVGITDQPPTLDALCASLAMHAQTADQVHTLRAQYFGVLPGFQRFVLCSGQVHLTLCIGPLVAMLREQQFIADTVFLGQASFCADRLQAKPLARLCRKGTRLAMGPMADAPTLMAALRSLGFQERGAPPDSAFSPAGSATGTALEYAPPWTPPTSRHAWRHPVQTPSDCVVLGAGLAGAAVASALALRGWQVTVVDAAPQPASGASALPAGLMAMPLTRDDAPRTRLARAGIRQTLRACHTSLQAGRDWQACGVLDLDPDHAGDAAQRLPASWPPQAADWSCTLDDARVPDAARSLHTDGALWHAHAAWVRPAALVQALLSHHAIRFLGGSRIVQAVHDGGAWQVQDARGATCASARHLVLCLANDSTRLLRTMAAHAPTGAGGRDIVALADMQGVAGTLSGGLHQAGDDGVFPAFAVRGAGHFQAHVPGPQGPMWWTGATFEPRATQAGTDAAAVQAAHAFNLQRLQTLLPEVAQRLAPRFACAEVTAWSGVRCATADRLPAAGPLHDGPLPTLWTSTAMGARGLSYAPLCAELLAAQMCGEPLPVEASLAQALQATRPRLRALRRAAAPAP